MFSICLLAGGSRAVSEWMLLYREVQAPSVTSGTGELVLQGGSEEVGGQDLTVGYN